MSNLVYIQELRDYTDARYCSEQIAYNTRTKMTFVPKITQIDYDPYERDYGWQNNSLFG